MRLRASALRGRIIQRNQVPNVGGLGGAEGNRTPDLLNAIQALSQLSYGPSAGQVGWLPAPGRRLTKLPRPIAQEASHAWRHRCRGAARVREIASWPVSRVLSGGEPSATAIHLGLGSLPASSNQPGRRLRSCLVAGVASAPVPPLFGLAPGGVCRAASVAGDAVRSYRTLSPLPFRGVAPAIQAVCFLLHFPWGRPRRPLAVTVDPWSPDFPPPVARQRPSGQLANAIRASRRRRSRGQEGQIRNSPPPSPRQQRGRSRPRGGRSGWAGRC
jgi:hypothetical protein